MTIALAAAALFGSCKDDVEMKYPPKQELPELPIVEGIHDNVKAPLYWSVYEYCYEQERQGVSTIDITPDEWDKMIDFVATDLKPYGYDMILQFLHHAQGVLQIFSVHNTISFLMVRSVLPAVLQVSMRERPDCYRFWKIIL